MSVTIGYLWLAVIGRDDPHTDWIPIGLFPWNHRCCAELIEKAYPETQVFRVEEDSLNKAWFGPFDRDYWDAYGLLSAVPFPNEKCVTYKDGKYTFHPEKRGN